MLSWKGARESSRIQPLAVISARVHPTGGNTGIERAAHCMTFLARPAARAHRQISAAASALADEANLIHLPLIREVFGKSRGASFWCWRIAPRAVRAADLALGLGPCSCE